MRKKSFLNGSFSKGFSVLNALIHDCHGWAGFLAKERDVRREKSERKTVTFGYMHKFNSVKVSSMLFTRFCEHQDFLLKFVFGKETCRTWVLEVHGRVGSSGHVSYSWWEERQEQGTALPSVAHGGRTSSSFRHWLPCQGCLFFFFELDLLSSYAFIF